MKNQWLESSNNFFLRETSIIKEKLPVGIYKTVQNLGGEIFLQRMSDKFELPKKVYDFDSAFIERLLKTFKENNRNLGALLNGIKGTGKSVTAKIFCNRIDIPTIVVTESLKGLPEFINSIQQNVVVFFDEYEKMYHSSDHSILTVMDGVLDNGYKRVFLFTTNNPSVNENLLQRPGRIRYIKPYGDLSLAGITEIVDDLLINKSRRDSVIKFISELTIITVDIVSEVIKEVNIHDEDPEEFADIFNVTKLQLFHNVYTLFEKDGSLVESLQHPQSVISPVVIDETAIGKQFTINKMVKGTILNVDKYNKVIHVKHVSNNESTVSMYRIEEYQIIHRNFKL